MYSRSTFLSHGYATKCLTVVDFHGRYNSFIALKCLNIVSTSILPDVRDALCAGGGSGGPGTIFDFTSDMVACPPNLRGQQDGGRSLNEAQMFTTANLNAVDKIMIPVSGIADFTAVARTYCFNSLL
jgi:hypothetical protein